MSVYDQQEAEASDLYNAICANIELYNRKITTLNMTRDIIQDFTGPDEFIEWDMKFQARIPLTIDTVQILVSIFPFFFFKFCYIFLIVEHYQTFLNTFEHLFSGRTGYYSSRNRT